MRNRTAARTSSPERCGRIAIVTLLVVLTLTACSGGSSPTDPGDNGDPPLPNPDGVLLEGDAQTLAIDATRVLPPSPVTPDLIDEGRLTTRLTAIIEPAATVGEVNAALEDEATRIVTMSKGDLFVSLRTPPTASLADAQARADRLVASGAFLFARPAVERRPEPVALDVVNSVDRALRIVPPDGHGDIDHLIASYVPAAWNALRLAQQRAHRVRVLVPDFYASSEPSAQINAQSFVPGLGSPFTDVAPEDDSHTGNHGFHCAGIIGANFDEVGPTGVSPDPTLLLDIRSMHVAGLSSLDWLQHIAAAFPSSGNFILSTSLGYGGDDQLVKDDFIELAFGALAWRVHAARQQGRFLHATAAGNEAQTGGLRALADWASEFAVAARWDDARALIPVDSLSAAEWEGIDQAWDAIVAQHPEAATALNNTLVVGSSDWGGGESEFSNRGSDVRAVGELVLAPCVIADAGYPADSTLCDGNTAQYSGTSMATPLVAGIAAYLWSLDPSLDPSQLAGALRTAYQESRTPGLIDAHLAVLALDHSVNDAPVRLSLLDIAGASVQSGPNGVFDEIDVEAFLMWFESYEIERAQSGSLEDYSRYDLNGDGVTGSEFVMGFDLNIDGAILGSVSLDACSPGESFDESVVSDRDVLRYYAYSPLYQGDPDRRAELLCGGPFLEITGLPERVSPGETVTVTITAGMQIGSDRELQAGVALDVRVINGTQSVISGTTDANGEFTTTVTMRQEQPAIYMNEFSVRATATIDDREVTAEVNAVRPDAIVMYSRTVEISALVLFSYRGGESRKSATVFYTDIDSTDWWSDNAAPVNWSLALDESADAEDMSVHTRITQSHSSQILGSATNFAGLSFTGISEGFVTLDDPNFELESYNARADGETKLDVRFAVYGRPASFTISGSISGPRVYFVWLFGPAGTEPFGCEYDDGCGAISGGGELQPGLYSFVGVERDYGVISWCDDCENMATSGTQSANGSLAVTLSVGH